MRRYSRHFALATAFLIVLCAGTLQGCTAFNAAINSGGLQTQLLQDGVQLGTQALIALQPTANRTTVAQQIMQAVQIAQAVVGNQAVGASSINTDIATALAKTKLAPPLQILLAQVASQAVAYLQTAITKGLLNRGSQAPLQTVLVWINTAATPYTQATLAAALTVPDARVMLVER